MRYNYREGAQRQKGRKWLILPLSGLLLGAYLLLNALTPMSSSAFIPVDETAKKLVSTRPNINKNRLYVPKVNIDVAIVPIQGNEAIALEKGAIHRAATSGNPKDGGNFVITAHRFNLGLTPAQTRAQSPFYSINKLNQGDAVYVDYQGVRYAYKVTERKMVKPEAVEIENRTATPRLTMYSSELAGPKASREVVIAEPQGTIVWNNGKPALNAL